MATREEKLAEARRIAKLNKARQVHAGALNLNPAQERIIGGANAIAEGATFGFADEAMAAGGATFDKLMGKDFTDSFNERMARSDAESSAYEQQHPAESMALNVGGTLATGGIGLGKAAFKEGVRFLPRVLKTMGIGATEGGVIGAASANNDMESRLKGGATGALLGGGLGAGTTAIGGLSRALTRRNIAQDLVQQDGSQIPAHMAEAPGESRIADFYRNTVGGSFGGGGLRHQERPLLDAAEQKVAAARAQKDALQDQAENLITARQDNKAQTALTVQNRVGQLQGQSGQALQDAERWVAGQSQREKRQIQAAAADRSLPMDAPQELRKSLFNAPPKEARSMLKKWWSDNGFSMVKGRDFEWTGGLKNRLEQLVGTDPALALKLGDVWARIPGMMERMQEAAMKLVKPGQAMTVADTANVTRAALSQITHINGDALMAMRNFFARASNNTSREFDSGALRQVANAFDDEIRAGLGRGSAEEAAFNDHVSRWGANAAFKKATRLARKEGKDFSPEQWITSLGQREDGVLENEAVTAIAGRKDRKQALEAFKERRGELTDQRVKTEKQSSKQKQRALDKATKQQVKAAKKTGRKGLDEALAAQAELHKRTIPSSSVFSKIARTAMLGGGPSVAQLGLLPGVGAAVPVGAAIAKALQTKAGQRLMSGQTEFQKAMAEALRKQRKLHQTLGRSVWRGTAQQVSQED